MQFYAADSALAIVVVVDRGSIDADVYGEAIVRVFLHSSDIGEEPDLAHGMASVMRHGLVSMQRMRQLAAEHERSK